MNLIKESKIVLILVLAVLGIIYLIKNPVKFGEEMVYIIIAGSFSLIGVWLGSALSKHQTKEQFLIETRRVIYAKLLSAVISEERRPVEPNPTTPENVDRFTERLREWRKNRKTIKSLAVEALLIAEDEVLKGKLSEFISTDDPNERLHGMEEIMRKEIGI